jgi:hypothetical protein
MSDNTKDKTLVKCADCLHAKVFREVSGDTGRYLLKVKCAKEHWKVGRKHGHCDLHRVLARRKHGCDDYVSMSDDDEDRRRSLQDLADSLPLERILYEPNGEAVDITEVMECRSAM